MTADARGNRLRMRGAALVIAMLIAALAATVAASLASSQQQWFATVSHRSEQVQAQALAQAGVQWARQILFEDKRTGTLDHLGEPWALPLPATPIENGAIEGRIVDAQSMLNLNSLADAGSGAANAERRQFERLFARLALPATTLDAIADWVDSDATVRPNGAEDAYYARQAAPRLTANADLARSAELSLVRGMSAESVNALAPYVTALPRDAKLNVNTASPAVLASAIEGLEAGALASLVAERARKPFSGAADLSARLPTGASLYNDGALAFSSDFFLVSVRARQGTTYAQARALLKRRGGEWPTVEWQILE